ncbi:MAG: hypothetical protein IV086_10400 [Hyphomonadaceae bacterium]|nr:hypothetical protein [Hyphomonadaceae bacterium]
MIDKSIEEQHAEALAALKARFGDNVHEEDFVTLAFPHPREAIDPAEWNTMTEGLMLGDIERWKKALLEAEA